MKMELHSRHALRPLVDCLADLAIYGFAFDAATPRGYVAPVVEPALTERDTGFARYSASLRNFVVHSGTMVVHPYLVGLLASTTGDACHLRLMLEPAAFLAHFGTAVRQRVEDRITSLRVERRAQLTGDAPAGDIAVDRRIADDILLRRLEREISAYCARTVDLRAPAASVPNFPMPEVRVSDPLSRNLVVLALRRAYFGRSASGHTRVFNLSPHAFGRALTRRNQLSEADFVAALASIQVTLLTLNKTGLR